MAQKESSSLKSAVPKPARMPVDIDELILQEHGFELQSQKLGAGEYSVVKTAMHKHFGLVAVKIIDKTSKNVSNEFLNKFLPRELDILRRIQHVNVVKMHEIMERDSKVYIAMELASKGNLLEMVQNKLVLPVYQAKFFLRQIVEALSYIHGLGIVHRDLKCENILLDNCFNTKIGDLGFARVLRQHEVSITFCGSIAYAAPEIRSGRPYQGYASDMWSLGIVLYVMLCGRYPFSEDVDLNDFSRTRKEIPMVQYPSRSKQLNEQVKDVIQRLLEPDILVRWACRDVIDSVWMQDMPYFTLESLTEEMTELKMDATQKPSTPSTIADDENSKDKLTTKDGGQKSMNKTKTAFEGLRNEKKRSFG